jgi:DHA2 family metal-tetracycline-proton antiporter-like MFS transporter
LKSQSLKQPAEITPHFQSRVVALLCCIVFFSVLNGTMFNVVVPDISSDYGLTAADVSWVITGYIIVFALASVTYGKLADIYPIRRLLTIGLLLFNVGALLGYFTDNYTQLLIGRLVQASGAGAIPAMAMLVATRYFPANGRGRVLGAVASTVAFGAGVGPVVGGYIAGHWHWRYLFLISLVTLFAIYAARRLLPQEPTRDELFDYPGALSLGVGVTCLLLFVTKGFWLALFLSIALFTFFYRHIYRIDNPFVSPELLKNRQFRQGLISTFLGVSTVFGYFFAIPLLLREVHTVSTADIGLVIFPGAISAALLGVVGGHFADRWGSVPIVHAGFGLLLLGYLLLAGLLSFGALPILLLLIICYSGFAFLQSALAKTVSMTLQPERAGVGMGLYNLVFFTSGAFGTSFVGTFLDRFDRFFPVSDYGSGAAFSGLFIAAAFAVLLAILLFRRTFGWGGKSP